MSEAFERPSKVWLAVIAVLALALRLACVAQYEASHPLAQRPTIDEASYDSWAREIADGEVVGREIFFQEPLYPYFLGAVYAAAGDEPRQQRWAARVTQSALGAVAAVLVALIASRCFGARAGVLAGVGFALYSPAIWFSALLLKPGLFLPLLALLLLKLVEARRVRDWFFVGVLTGLGALLRGNMLLLSPVVALWPFARARVERSTLRASLAGALAVVIGAAVVLAPVAARNHHVGGRFVLTTSGAGTNFYGGNNLDNPFGVATEFDWVRGVPAHEADDWRHEASRRSGRELDATETSSFWLREALASMRAQPLEHVRILWRKLRLALSRYETPDNHFLEWDRRFVGILRAPLPGFGTIGLLGLCGVALALVEAWRSRNVVRGATLATFFVLYLGTIVLTVMSDRARLPLVIALTPFAGWCAHRLASWRIESTVLARAAPLWVVAALAVFTPAGPSELRERDFDERDHNLAVALLEDGELEACAPILDRLLERHPGAARVALLAAEFEYRRARELIDAAPPARRIPERAGELLTSAFQRLEGVERRGTAQERFRAQVLGGAIHQYFGHWKDAELRYRAALEFDPGDRDVRRRLAVVVAESAMLAPAGAQRAERLREAITLLEGLLAEAEDEEVRALLEKMRAQSL